MKNKSKIILPRPFAVAVDDMGWMNGGSLAESGGPWRLGFKRKMRAEDYAPFVEIGAKLGVRFQTLFVLAEMDRLNVLRDYPTTTQAGKKWDNSENVSPEQIRIMDFVKENAAHIEFGLHGVGHEHWENGKRTRAEWYDMENDKPWPESDLHAHVEAYKKILAQYGLSEENGHSFPESFVPCGWALYWNPGGEYSTASVLRQYGVKYANTWFEKIPELNPPIKEGGGLDHGILILNRYNYGNDWYMVGTPPLRPISEFETDVIESHWSNWLATDDFLQPQVNQAWINFLTEVQRTRNRYLAKNSEQFYSQWIYKKFVKITFVTETEIELDVTKIPDEYYENDLTKTLVLKVKPDENERVSSAELDGEKIPAYYESEGYAFLYLPPLKQKKYTLKIKFGKKPPDKTVWLSGTYNVYKRRGDKKSLEFEIRTYGKQQIEIFTEKPKRTYAKGEIKITDRDFNPKKKLLCLTVETHNIQGGNGKIILTF